MGSRQVMSLAASPTMVEPIHGAEGDSSSRGPRTRRPQPSPAVAMMTIMLRRSLLFAHAAWLVALGLAFWVDGPLGVANAAVGGGAVVFFYAAGQGIQMLAGEMDPQSGMGLTVVSFVTRAGLLGLLLLGLGASESLQAVFRPVSFFSGLVIVLVGWLAGMFVAWSRMRVPVYDADWDPRPLVRSRGMRPGSGGRHGGSRDQRDNAGRSGP